MVSVWTQEAKTKLWILPLLFGALAAWGKTGCLGALLRLACLTCQFLPVNVRGQSNGSPPVSAAQTDPRDMGDKL